MIIHVMDSDVFAKWDSPAICVKQTLMTAHQTHVLLVVCALIWMQTSAVIVQLTLVGEDVNCVCCQIVPDVS